jgi:hypothetical protein
MKSTLSKFVVASCIAAINLTGSLFATHYYQHIMEKATDDGDVVEMKTKVKFQVAESDRHLSQNWPKNAVLRIRTNGPWETPNTTYKYQLVYKNPVSNHEEFVQANVIAGPQTGPKDAHQTRQIKEANVETGTIILDNDSVWEVFVNAETKKVFSAWKKGDSIMIGDYDITPNFGYNNILINFSKQNSNLHVRRLG